MCTVCICHGYDSGTVGCDSSSGSGSGSSMPPDSADNKALTLVVEVFR